MYNVCIKKQINQNRVNVVIFDITELSMRDRMWSTVRLIWITIYVCFFFGFIKLNAEEEMYPIRCFSLLYVTFHVFYCNSSFNQIRYLYGIQPEKVKLKIWNDPDGINQYLHFNTVCSAHCALCIFISDDEAGMAIFFRYCNIANCKFSFKRREALDTRT